MNRFDLSVRGPDGVERLFFGLLAALCRPCGRLQLDADSIRLFGIDERDVTSAIVSDGALRPANGTQGA